MINSISIALSGLQSSSKKVLVATQNIVNADSTGSLDSDNPFQPYAAQTTMDKSLTVGGEGSGVQTVVLKRDPPFVQSFEPDSPLADENGMVAAPNVNLDEEMLNMKVAEMAYTANLQTVKTSQKMQDSLIQALNHKA